MGPEWILAVGAAGFGAADDKPTFAACKRLDVTQGRAAGSAAGGFHWIGRIAIAAH